MTEEEKKAIEYVNNILDYELHYCEDEDVLLLSKIDKEQIKTVLNIIQKQQEEIEEKDKVLHEMAEWIFDKDYGKNSLLIHRDDYYSNCVKQVIKNFEKKVEEK